MSVLTALCFVFCWYCQWEVCERI